MYLPIVPEVNEREIRKAVSMGKLKEILERVEKNFTISDSRLEELDYRIKNLESFNNVKQEFSSSTEDFGLF